MKFRILISITAVVLLLAALSFKSDPLEGYEWRTIETVGEPIPVEENSFVEVGGKLYVVGGRGVQEMSVFDPATSTWSRAAAPPVELNHIQAIVYKGEIIVCGAMKDAYPHEVPLPSLYIYNPTTDQWREGAKLPEHRIRASGGVVVYKDKIYFVNGIQDGHWTGHVNWFDEYDPKTGTWKELPNSPTARDHFAAAVVGDKLYCIGGRRSNGAERRVFQETVDNVDIYDFKTGTWRTADAKLPTMRAGAGVVTIGDEVLVIGGESASQQTAHSEVEAFNVKTERFRKLPSLVRGRHGTGALVYKNKVYTAVGVGNRGGSPKLMTIEVFEKVKK